MHRRSAHERRAQFTADVKSPGATLVPGAYDALSATLIERAGFRAAYIGSFAAAASGFGLPDVGLLTLTELTDAARRLVDATDLPILSDGEAAFYEPANIWRTVRAFEEAGTVGIHIEDNKGGKHSDSPAGLMSAGATAQRIRAAVDAREDPDFLIIARSDALWVNCDLDETVDRLLAYVDAGADAVFAPGISAEQLASVRSSIPVPVMVLGDLATGHGSDEPPSTLAEFEDAGADLIVLFYHLLGVASAAVGAALADLHDTGVLRGARAEPASRFEGRMGYDRYSERVARYAEVTVG